MDSVFRGGWHRWDGQRARDSDIWDEKGDKEEMRAMVENGKVEVFQTAPLLQVDYEVLT